MVTDQEIANGVATVLRQSDPNAVTTVNGVIEQLEAKLGLDLSHKASFIRHQIDLLLRPHLHPNDHFALPHAPHFPFSPPNPHPHPHLHPHPHHHPQRQQQQQQHFPPPSPAAAAPPPPHPAAPDVSPKESAPTTGKRRGGPGGLNKLCGVSPALQAIVGQPAMTRTQIVKELWAYIRKNNLQDPSNKRKIICNDELRLLFETDCTDMFKMNKLLAKHIITLEPTKDPGPDAKRLKATSMQPKVECNEPGSSPVIISTALAKFFGTDEREMSQSEVVRRVYEYIRIKRLEDPLNAMVILCDAKLRDLFGCEKFLAMSVSDMLTNHLFTQS